jgi:hypothetical protein
MVIETQLTLKKYRSFCYKYLYSHALYRVFTLYGIVLMLSFIFHIPDSNIILLFDILGAIIIVIVVPLKVGRKAERTFKGSNLLNEKMIYEFADEKLSIRGETFKAEYQWDKIAKMKELKNWVVLFFGKRAGFIIPKEAFGDGIEEFRKLVNSKIRMYHNGIKRI